MPSSADPTPGPRDSLAAPQKLALGTGRSALGGKASGQYPVLPGRKVEALLSHMGSSAKVEDGGGWPGNAS